MGNKEQSNVHYSRTMTTDNLSKAANTVGEWVLTGLGKVGQVFNGLLTAGASTDFGQTSPFVMSSAKERRAIQRGRQAVQKKANEKIAQGMTWVSPLNYGVALWNGHGLNARKGEEEIASWSPAWQAVGRVGELYLGPKAVKGPRAVINAAAKAGVKPAKAAVIAREIKQATKNKPKHTEVPSKNLFRAKVYKGGDIKDPNSAFFTTDIKYARQYGPAQEYIIETKNPAFTKEPMMGYRDPVSQDMFVYEATKNNPEATMIIGHDANTGEFAYQSNGMEMLSLSPNNIIKTGQRRPMNKTYPVYLGPKHSIKEVVNADGTINPRAAMRIQHEIAGYFDGYKMEHRLEDPRWHRNDPTTYQHTKNVAKSAWGIDTPIGFTKQDQMVAAIGHDFGKMVSGDGHAQIGADLLKQVFPDITEAQYKAIAEHMEVPTTPLGKVTKQADIRNGVTRTKQDNGKIRLSLPSSTEKAPRQIVLEPSQVGDNKYYVHIRTWDDVQKQIPARISEYDKRQLFDALYDELPEGAEILFPKSGPGNYATRGTVAGLQHLSMDPRFTPGTKGTLQYLDKDGKTVKTYQGTSYIKKRRGNIFNNSEPLTIEQIQNFIDNDIIPRLKEQGHQVESYKPNVRTADFQNDIFDQKMRGENGGAWFSPSTNDITLRGPLENQDFGLVIHETGGHGIRYNMQSDYKPVSRQAINEYLADPDNPAKQEPLLKGHFGNEVFNEFEINTLADSYPEIASYFNNFINRLSGKKLSPEALAKRIRHEQGAVNTQFRAKLSENGRLTGKALNKKIQETPEGVILRMEIEQGYTSAGILERISKITGVSMDELNFYNPASLQKLAEKFPELKIIANKVKYAMTHVAVGTGVMYGINQYGLKNDNK